MVSEGDYSALVDWLRRMIDLRTKWRARKYVVIVENGGRRFRVSVEKVVTPAMKVSQ